MVKTVFVEGLESTRRPVLEALAKLRLRGLRVDSVPQSRLRGVHGRACRNPSSNSWYGYYTALMREHLDAPSPPGDTATVVVRETSAAVTFWSEIQPRIDDFDDYHRHGLMTEFRKRTNAEVAGEGVWVYLAPPLAWPAMEESLQRLRYRGRPVHLVEPPHGDARRAVDVAREIATLVQSP